MSRMRFHDCVQEERMQLPSTSKWRQSQEAEVTGSGKFEREQHVHPLSKVGFSTFASLRPQ